MRLVILLLLLASTALAEPMPDPITKPLSEQEARSEASRLARDAFTKRSDIKDANGKKPAPAAFAVKHEKQRWSLSIDPPAGAWAVDVGFATE
jgi:hypothetical protein